MALGTNERLRDLKGDASNIYIGEMLRGLTDDHLGTTRHYYFDIPFDETVERHAGR